jgi:hypothetical protein
VAEGRGQQLARTGRLHLTNFGAKIVSDITQDDGIETARAVEIEARLNGRTYRFCLPAVQFSQMSWPLEHLGAEAALQPGQGTKDRARHAIQLLSGRIRQHRVYTHTGWRQVESQAVYMDRRGGAHTAQVLLVVGPLAPRPVPLRQAHRHRRR